ncbi:MAG: hypothetical protein ACO23S_06270 [Candidatus Nanopelagicaceae bacterium]|jgi:hypothetical protein|nr:hypothetical protein [Actinomycetota bacterium]
MRQTSEEEVAQTISRGFPEAVLRVVEADKKKSYQIVLGSEILVEIDDEKVKMNFPTMGSGTMHWSGILEGTPETVGEMILRNLANAGFKVFSRRGIPIKKAPVRITTSTICPSCKERGTIKEILYGLPDEQYDREKYVSGGCCLDPEGNDPEIQCTSCEWQGDFEEVRFSKRGRE